MKRWLLAILVPALALADSGPAFAYLKMGFDFGGRQLTMRWTRFPVRYVVSDAGVPGVTAVDVQAAAAHAFGTWQAVPTASITYQFAWVTSATPGAQDGLSTIGFANRPELDRVLAATSFLVDLSTGAIVESDIFINAIHPWSVAPAGEARRFDLESILLHEIGHLSGLGHSAIGETEILAEGGRRVIAAATVMFPIAFGPGSIVDRTLRADDVAGISDLYPDQGFIATSGSVSGRVTKNGAGVFGAHVVAFNLATGSLVANFSLDSRGDFSIAGLTPGLHVVRVEPLDDADINGFFDDTAPVDVDFRVVFSDRLVVVPRGGDSGAIEVKVVRK